MNTNKFLDKNTDICIQSDSDSKSAGSAATPSQGTTHLQLRIHVITYKARNLHESICHVLVIVTF